MTESEKKEYLREYKVLGVQLAHDIAELNHWKSLAQDESADKIRELSDAIELDVKRITDKRGRITEAIEGIENKSIRMVLYYHYIVGMDLLEVAHRMNYCYRQITRNHKQGLEKIKI